MPVPAGAALGNPSTPGLLVLGVELEPALSALFGADIAMVAEAMHVGQAARCGAIQGLELDSLFEREPNDHAPPSGIDQIPPRRILPWITHVLDSLKRSSPIRDGT